MNQNNKPIFHITGEKGWINDPNGVIKFKGQYHVFYQHHPFSCQWGPMHWGHVVSDDLLHWQYLPIALTPGDEFDKDGCFSGSALVYQDKLYVFYTGFIFNEDNEKIRQQQCLAYSEDGIAFHKLGLIIGEDNLPKEYVPNDFRDPMVFPQGDTFIMLVAARRINGRGNILRYESKDLIHWTFAGDILQNDSKGIMIECPYYVKDLSLLLYSEQFLPIEGYKYHNIHSSLYSIGEFEENKFVIKYQEQIDYGFDFYAPQVFEKENIMIGWLDMWDRNNPSEAFGFAGMLTAPRKISIVDNKLYQTPILPKEVVVEKENITEFEDHAITGFYQIQAKDLKYLSINIRKGKEENTKFFLSNNEWIFDRSKSGIKITGNEKDEDSINSVRKMPYIKKDTDDFYILLDKYSVEIFVNGMSMSNIIYPSENSDLLQIKIDSSKNIFRKFGKI